MYTWHRRLTVIYRLHASVVKCVWLIMVHRGPSDPAKCPLPLITVAHESPMVRKRSMRLTRVGYFLALLGCTLAQDWNGLLAQSGTVSKWVKVLGSNFNLRSQVAIAKTLLRKQRRKKPSRHANKQKVYTMISPCLLSIEVLGRISSSTIGSPQF